MNNEKQHFGAQVPTDTWQTAAAYGFFILLGLIVLYAWIGNLPPQ